MDECSGPEIIREMHIKTKRLLFTLVRMAVIKRMDVASIGKVMENKEPLRIRNPCRQEHKLVKMS